MLPCIVAGYAASEKHDQLTSYVNKIASRDICIVLGDFNTKPGAGWKDFHCIVLGDFNTKPGAGWKDFHCIVLGDFNTKTGAGWKDFQENVGRYGKGHTNENGTTRIPI